MHNTGSFLPMGSAYEPDWKHAEGKNIRLWHGRSDQKIELFTVVQDDFGFVAISHLVLKAGQRLYTASNPSDSSAPDVLVLTEIEQDHWHTVL